MLDSEDDNWVRKSTTPDIANHPYKQDISLKLVLLVVQLDKTRAKKIFCYRGKNGDY